MTAYESAWQTVPEGLTLEGVVVSFQRFRCPPEGVVREAPASCGILPIAPGSEALLLAVPRGEAFWIGVLVDINSNRDVEITAELVDHTMIRLARYERSGAFAIEGIPRTGDRFDVFCRDTVLRLFLRNGTAVARIDLTGVEDFAAQTGRDPPTPFNPGAAYQGWRLP